MVSVETTIPIHGARVRRMVLVFGFAVAAALGALSATIFAESGVQAPPVAAPAAGAHMALYVQTQSWAGGAQAASTVSSVRRAVILAGLEIEERRKARLVAPPSSGGSGGDPAR